MQIIFILLLCFLPWVKEIKLWSIYSVATGFAFLLIIILGLYYRNHSWMKLSDVLPYFFNYFTALENLAISIRDFEPGFIRTFFMPFNKFLTPFGLSDMSLYYDMNHYLTDIYYPHAWEIRATEQWPVETDLYLNFYFVFGLPLVCLYLFFVGFFYGRARVSSSLGYWAFSLFMTIGIVTHLRGSLYNHVDFYLYPMWALIFFVFKRWRLQRS